MFDVRYRDMTPHHKHFLRQARRARSRYQEQQQRKQRNQA